jgi:hypothetical protein
MVISVYGKEAQVLAQHHLFYTPLTAGGQMLLAVRLQ